MKRKQFKIGINAPPTEVYYKKMLGIHNKDTYNESGKIFNPASTYEGNWKKGSKIAFTGTSKEGKPEVIFCIITKNIPNQYLSMRTQAIIEDGGEITERPEILTNARTWKKATGSMRATAQQILRLK
jgi:hypothetical protein